MSGGSHARYPVLARGCARRNGRHARSAHTASPCPKSEECLSSRLCGSDHHATDLHACSRRSRPRSKRAMQQVPALAQQQTPPPKDGLLGAIVKSLTGDVYAEPERWRPLSFSGFFTEGWDEAWV